MPGGAHDAADRGLEALVRIGDDQLHAPQAAADKALEERAPEGLGFTRPNVQADNLAFAVGVLRGDNQGECARQSG